MNFDSIMQEDFHLNCRDLWFIDNFSKIHENESVALL